MNSKTGYIKSLDGLRAIAIVLVMSFHAEITHFGWFGVQLFFVLSGFLITGILWKEKQNSTSLPYKFRKFWVRRSLRIFPLYFGYLLLIGLIYLFILVPTYFPDYVPYLFTYTFNYTKSLLLWHGDPFYTHLWSLSVEEQFYIFFPLIMFLCPPKIIRALMIIIIALTPIVRLFLFRHYSNESLSTPIVADAVYWNTLSHLDAFFIGGLIPVFSLDKKIKKPEYIFIIAFLIAFAAGLINYFSTDSGSYYFNDLGYNYGQTESYQYIWIYTCLNFLFASIILSMISSENKMLLKMQAILETNWLVRIGKVSYGMYLFHWAILVYVFNRFFATENLALKTLLFIPYVIVVYLFAELSFRLYESRFLNLKDSLFSKNKINNQKVQIISTGSAASSVLKPASNE